MTEFWVSQGKKFCEICKCYFGNNRASIEHHENGQRHKAALAVKIRDLGKARTDKDLQTAKMMSTIAHMESAALASMNEHGEGITHGPALPETGIRPTAFDPKQYKDVGSMSKAMANLREGGISAGTVSRGGLSNSLKTALKSEISTKAMSVNLTDGTSFGPRLSGVGGPQIDPFMAAAAAGPALPFAPPTEEAVMWVRAEAEDGRPYYWHIYDGSTTWERPGKFLTAEAYQQQLAELEKNKKQNYKGKRATESEIQKMERDTLKDFLKSKITSEGLAVPKDAEILKDDHGKKRKKRWDERGPKVKAERTEKEPKKERTAEEDSDIPLPPDELPTSSNVFYSGDVMITGLKDANEREQEYSEIKQEVPSVEDIITQQTGNSKSGPFGPWIRVTQEEKERNANFESPLTARYRELDEQKKQKEEELAKAEAAEPKIKFEEKTAAVLTKKVKGPIEFKKKSATKNIRKRTDI
ncbi:hypothetical protein WR25_19976 [Diploscapter pachys]|uniref:Matrin-type domain-containing protein n=1 Tax=Diploscapter pachys TaxID=2018661 RepID=A0A2A2KV16_9BILA|nr:hypothetical protein WR25_19976 [Diploscapter pachys]